MTPPPSIKTSSFDKFLETQPTEFEKGGSPPHHGAFSHRNPVHRFCHFLTLLQNHHGFRRICFDKTDKRANRMPVAHSRVGAMVYNRVRHEHRRATF